LPHRNETVPPRCCSEHLGVGGETSESESESDGGDQRSILKTYRKPMHGIATAEVTHNITAITTTHPEVAEPTSRVLGLSCSFVATIVSRPRIRVILAVWDRRSALSDNALAHLRSRTIRAVIANERA
ncbi:MAG: hypothetical protein ACOC0P_04960, partial [Planctomycetota bacterium]